MGNEAFLTEMGSRIAARRKQLHLTQERLAEMMDVSLQTVSCIELGKKAIRPENLVKLCNSLDTTADFILYGRRDEQQMSDLVKKLSELTPEEYEIVRGLVEHFHGKR